MTKYALTKRAEADLFEIFLFGYKQFGSKQAEAYAEDLERIFDLLAETPRMGREAPSIAEGVRRHEHASHVILYEEAPDGILILAVVHASSIIRLNL